MKLLRPLEEQSKTLRILLVANVFAVQDVDLHHQRLVLLHVVLEGVSHFLLGGPRVRHHFVL